MQRAVAICLATLGLFFFAITSVHAAGGYIDLQATGDDMVPTICNGDTVRVEIRKDGTQIKAGPMTSSSPGDIIVYFAGAVVSVPRAMWGCGRVISKRFENGEWYLQTKLDNASNPDPWEVPEHALFGVVVDVVHATRSSDTSREADSQGGQGSFVFDLLVGVLLGAALGLAAKEALSGSLPHYSFSGSFNKVTSGRAN